MDTRDGQAVPYGAFVKRHDTFHRQLRGVDDLGARTRVLENVRVDQARGPDDDVRPADGLAPRMVMRSGAPGPAPTNMTEPVMRACLRG